MAIPEFLLNAKIEDTDKMNKLENEIDDLKQKLHIANEMNIDTYNKYCKVLKENKKLEAELKLYKSTLSKNHALTHLLNDLEDSLDEELLRYQTGWSGQSMDITYRNDEHIKVLRSILYKIEELRYAYNLKKEE